MGITAKQRASYRLQVTSQMDPAAILELIKEAAASTKGGGKSLLTTGLANLGSTINVHRSTTTSLAMSITSGKKLIENCTFSARIEPAANRSKLTVGGLETYKTQQQKLLFVIPVGPKQIYGMDPYKRFLAAVAELIKKQDGSALVELGQAT